jgi:hypothetical protein
MELEELHARVVGDADKCATKARKLSTLVVGISNVLVDLGMLEVHEAKLAEEQAQSLYPFDRWDLPAELEEFHVCVAGDADECATKAGKLSMLVVGISNALVDLGMLPIQDIPQLPKMAQDVLAVASHPRVPVRGARFRR